MLICLHTLRFTFPAALMLLLSVLAQHAAAQSRQSLGESLLFHASFDEGPNADFAKGDAKLYTAETLQRKKVKAGLHSDAVTLDPEHGRYGGSLVFTKKSDQIVFFQGAGNVPGTGPGFQGAYSFWMQLDPERDLPSGYVDPLQITDKKWNDASFFVDFTKETPRVFRLGVFSNYKFWNPTDRKWDDIPDAERPLVPVKQLPFSRRAWTHVGITFERFNTEMKSGVATLYLNGESQGELRRPQQFTWDHEKLAILLGIYYVGRLDDFAVFDRALTAAEIKRIATLKDGVGSLR